MDAKVVWKGKLSFDGSAEGGISVPIGTRSSSGGDGDGISPMELTAIALAGCTAMDVIEILRKKRQNVTGFEVKVHAVRTDEHPRIFTNIMVEYVVTGRQVEKSAVERAVELSVTKYCSVQAMLGKSAQITHTITLLEDQT
jgi:putative redox protein